jgi:hypothetical protein
MVQDVDHNLTLKAIIAWRTDLEHKGPDITVGQSLHMRSNIRGKRSHSIEWTILIFLDVNEEGPYYYLKCFAFKLTQVRSSSKSSNSFIICNSDVVYLPTSRSALLTVRFLFSF